jgi:hypothetical protein
MQERCGMFRRRRPTDLLARASDAAFLSYVGALIGAGAWGALFAKTDTRVIEGWHPQEELAPRTAATVLSQHRFLRAMELGFGLFALRNRERFQTDAAVNRLFLGAMGTGIAVRAVGLAADGRPGPLPYLFGGSEVLAIGTIVAHTRRTVGT